MEREIFTARAVITVISNAVGASTKVSKTWENEQNKIFLGNEVIVQMNYDHVNGIIEILTEAEYADYVAEEIPSVILSKYGWWQLKNDQRLDHVDKCREVLDSFAY